MSAAQIELARHALGLPNKMRMSYRNRFVAGHGHVDGIVGKRLTYARLIA